MTELEKLVDYYNDNILAHAYLIETNDIEKCYLDLITTIKKFLCPNTYQSKCCKCNLCNLIDSNFLPSLITISPEGKNIKKEQILELKSRFCTKPIYTKENIYVVKSAECLNPSSANTMLKFLEEPEDNIIGFFITNNVNNVIDTIKSRCEIINVRYNIKKNDNNIFLKIAESYINNISNSIAKGLSYNKEVIFKKIDNKNDIMKLLNAMKLLYSDIFFTTYSNNIKKINILNDSIEKLYYNVNVELLLDNMVIELSD